MSRRRLSPPVRPHRPRIARHWLRGERAGTTDTFAGNLPGLPHNIHFDDAGLLWVGLYQGRDANVDRLAPRPRLKNLIARLPESMIAGKAPTRDSQRGRGSVLCLDPEGAILLKLDNPPARVDTVAAVIHDNGTL